MKISDFEKLLKFSELMGACVKIKESSKSDWAGTCEGTSIELFFSKKDSVVDKVLTLGHELGHLLDDRIRLKDVEAYSYLPETKEDGGFIPKWARSSIKNREDAADYYREIIFKMLNIKITAYKLELDHAINAWNYGYILHNNGKQPTRKQQKNFIRSWKEQKIMSKG